MRREIEIETERDRDRERGGGGGSNLKSVTLEHRHAGFQSKVGPNTCYPFGSYRLQSLCNRLLSVCPRSALMHRLRLPPSQALLCCRPLAAPDGGGTTSPTMAWRLRALQPRRRLPPWPVPWQSITIATSCSGGDGHAFKRGCIVPIDVQ